MSKIPMEDNGYVNDCNNEEQNLLHEMVRRCNRDIYFYSEIDRRSVLRLIDLLQEVEMELIILQHTHNIEPVIKLHINSDGGVVEDAFAAVDFIRNMKVKVHTIIEGSAASAATYLSMAGEKRFITKNSNMLIHELRAGVVGKYNEIKDNYLNVDAAMKQVVNFYMDYVDISKEELEELLKRELNLSAKECKKYGFVDEII